MSKANDRSPGALDRAALAQQRQKDREQQVRWLQSEFNKFGDQIMGLVLHSFNNDGNLRRLVHRVTGRVVPDAKMQSEVLQKFISRHGEGTFLRQAAIDPNASLTPNPDLLTPTPEDGTPSPERSANQRVNRREPTPLPGTGRLLHLPNGELIRDRRKEKERRTGQDRRNRLEAITKNKRFGGERRRQSRRKTPPKYVEPANETKKKF
jgi:hypothetical protein